MKRKLEEFLNSTLCVEDQRINDRDHCSNLPKDIWTVISEFLECKDHTKMLRVSKHFRQLFTTLTKSLLEDMVKDKVDFDRRPRLLRTLAKLRSQTHRPCFGFNSFPQRRLSWLDNVSCMVASNIKIEGDQLLFNGSSSNPAIGHFWSHNITDRYMANLICVERKVRISFYRMGDSMEYSHYIELPEQCFTVSSLYLLELLPYHNGDNIMILENKNILHSFDTKTGKAISQIPIRNLAGCSPDVNHLYTLDIGHNLAIKEYNAHDLQQTDGDIIISERLSESRFLEYSILFVNSNTARVDVNQSHFSKFHYYVNISDRKAHPILSAKITEDDTLEILSGGTVVQRIEQPNSISLVAFSDHDFYAIVHTGRSKSEIYSVNRGFLFDIDDEIVQGICQPNGTYIQTKSEFLVIPSSLHKIQ